ncbi:LysM peptidoglycan-binding domain-containing protein [Thalassorhabdus alkalitolerans]|uniref:LysM peptidoglycan-binding domain-containing protein n=1 Tax=Thalassorhabdus alkalitolerans TaxID=2282697 RepID=A0ABW0YNE3_9BACI
MTHEHASTLSFNIEESVWLNKGQKIQEIISLGLEPDIRIEEHEEEVVIKGGLHLKGEYYIQDKEEDSLQEDHRANLQVVEEATVNKNGEAEIEHFFPIDVTIPLHRIQNLDDIFVQVEGFDYDLPDPGCIQLTADITISGMKEEHKSGKQKSSRPYTENWPESFPSFFTEAKKEADQARYEQQEDIEVKERDNIFPSMKEGNEETQERNTELPEAEESESQVSVYYKKDPEEMAAYKEAGERTSSLEENQSLKAVEPEEKAEQTEETEEVIENEETIETEENPDDQVRHQEIKEEEMTEPVEEKTVPLNREEEQTVVSFEPRSEEQEKSEEAEEQETVPAVSSSSKDENSLYLTKVLTKGEEEFSRLKMCIIQENESLDTIAKRYDLTTSHLLRVNRLDSEHIEEGEILYIPVTASRKNES